MGLYQTKKILHNIENHNQNEKETYWMKKIFVNHISKFCETIQSCQYCVTTAVLIVLYLKWFLCYFNVRNFTYKISMHTHTQNKKVSIASVLYSIGNSELLCYFRWNYSSSTANKTRLFFTVVSQLINRRDNRIIKLLFHNSQRKIW